MAIPPRILKNTIKLIDSGKISGNPEPQAEIAKSTAEIINELFDKRLHEKCVRTHHEAWIVWNFSKYKEPYFRSDTLYLKDQFPVFPTVYRVFVKRNAHQSFLSCSCLHYDRCGIPC